MVYISFGHTIFLYSVEALKHLRENVVSVLIVASFIGITFLLEGKKLHRMGIGHIRAPKKCFSFLLH